MCLVLGTHPTPPKNFIKIYLQLANKHCKMSVYAISPNGKEYWKMTLDPQKNYCHQNLTDPSPGDAHLSQNFVEICL